MSTSRRCAANAVPGRSPEPASQRLKSPIGAATSAGDGKACRPAAVRTYRPRSAYCPQSRAPTATGPGDAMIEHPSRSGANPPAPGRAPSVGPRNGRSLLGGRATLPADGDAMLHHKRCFARRQRIPLERIRRVGQLEIDGVVVVRHAAPARRAHPVQLGRLRGNAGRQRVYAGTVRQNGPVSTMARATTPPYHPAHGPHPPPRRRPHAG